MKQVLVGLAVVAACWGQNTGQNVVTAVTLPTTTYTTPILTNIVVTSASVQNIGQSSHQFVLVATNNSGIANNVVATVEGSTDCSHYFDISNNADISNQRLLSGVNIIKTLGYLTYPCVRTKATLVLGTAGSSVTLTGTYIGNSTPAATLIDMFGNSGMRISAGGSIFYGTGASYGGSILGNSSPTAKITVYGLTISAPSTAGDVLVYCGYNAGVNSDGSVLWLQGTGAGNSIWPQSVRPYFQCPPGDILSYVSIAGSGSASVTIQFRME